MHEFVPEHRAVSEERLPAGLAVHGGQSGGDPAGAGAAQAESIIASQLSLMHSFARQLRCLAKQAELGSRRP